MGQDMTIYVGNFPSETSADQLREVFESYGKVRKIHVISDSVSGRGLGFGFVDMFSQRHAQEAIDGLQHTPLGGRVMMVCAAAGREERRIDPREV